VTADISVVFTVMVSDVVEDTTEAEQVFDVPIFWSSAIVFDD
jgi:hypothetical protein